MARLRREIKPDNVPGGRNIGFSHLPGLSASGWNEINCLMPVLGCNSAQQIIKIVGLFPNRLDHDPPASSRTSHLIQIEMHRLHHGSRNPYRPPLPISSPSPSLLLA
jgi:hypothetical protein